MSVPMPQRMPVQEEKSQAERDLEVRRARELNLQRQKDLRDDTQKLFQLATELKEAVDKSNENVLSLEVVRKAEEVEKLAHKVKEKMKDMPGQPPKNEIPKVPIPTFPPH
ncbi:MAG TPA: hypothetical protein VEW69_01910 [Alphaproteobacteria bacterium]|nr:hypothetical protein [Alphaproteobacteria bacterium]